MMPQKVPWFIRSLHGGINTKQHPTQLGEYQAVATQNAVVTEPGKVRQRKGYEQVGDTPDSYATRRLAAFRPDSGTNELHRVAGSTWKKWTGSGNWTDVATGLSPDLETDLVQANNKMYLFNGTDAVQAYDGSTVVPVAAMPKGTTAVYFANRIFVAGVSGNENLVYASDIYPSLETGYGAGLQFKFDPGRGGKIVKLLPYRNRELIVFMENSIELLNVAGATPSSDWYRQVIDASIGCAAADSVVAVGADIYFMDQQGQIRSLVRTIQDASQGTDSIPISDPIFPTLDALNKSRLSECRAVLWDRVYWLAVPTAGSDHPDVVYGFDTVLKAWFGPMTNMAVGSWAASDVEADGWELYFGANDTGGKTYRAFDGYDDDGTAIEMSIESREYDQGHIELEKVWNELEATNQRTDDYETGGLIYLDARIDGDNDGYTNIGSYESAGVVGLYLPFYLPGQLVNVPGLVREQFHMESFRRGRTIQFRIRHDELSRGCQFISLYATASVQAYEGEGNEP